MDLDNKVILITGGTGSLGRKLTQTILARWKPRKLIIFSRDEYKQFEMQKQFSADCLRFFIGDVHDGDRLRRAMYGVDYVIHAAAMKQVPACEYNPIEAVKTNVVGVANVIESAIDSGVKKVLAVSTDKAVNPVNLYGATKLCGEKLFVQGNAYAGSQGTRFSCARYGNVVGSRGSVVPLFLQQRLGGELSVTDKCMTRFWITLEQGVDFVLRCLGGMHGGEIFVPKIPSTTIVDLARAVAPECKICVTGIRPGEKMHELLVSPDEARHALEFPDMFVIQPVHSWWETKNWVGGRVLPEGFSYGSDNNSDRLSVEALRDMIREYIPSEETEPEEPMVANAE